MTKLELLRQLEGFADETYIVIWLQGTGELDLLRASYQPMSGDSPAFVHLVARQSSVNGRAE